MTPLIVRVVFLRRKGRSWRVSCGVRRAMISELEGTFSRWYLAAVLIFRVLSWFRVGWGICFKVSTISRRAVVFSKLVVPEYGLV